MSQAMELSERQFEQIGSYVREHLGTWVRDISPPVATVQLDPVYLERIVRVEEELKSQRELMKQGFEAMDKRFEEARADTNTRFDAVERRFEDMNARFEGINTRFEDMNARFDDVNKRFEDINTRFEDMNTRFEDMNTRFEDMNTRFDDVNKRFEDMNARFGQMERHMNRWMAVLAVLVSIVGVAGPVVAKYL
jgi:chromosome segregation ATPase